MAVIQAFLVSSSQFAPQDLHFIMIHYDQDPRVKECQKNGCKTDITEGGLLRRTVIIRKLVGLNGKEVDLWQLMLFKLKLKKKK